MIVRQRKSRMGRGNGARHYKLVTAGHVMTPEAENPCFHGKNAARAEHGPSSGFLKLDGDPKPCGSSDLKTSPRLPVSIEINEPTAVVENLKIVQGTTRGALVRSFLARDARCCRRGLLWTIKAQTAFGSFGYGRSGFRNSCCWILAGSATGGRTIRLDDHPLTMAVRLFR